MWCSSKSAIQCTCCVTCNICPGCVICNTMCMQCFDLQNPHDMQGAIEKQKTANTCNPMHILCYLQGQVPDYILDMAVAAMQHGVAPGSLVALLNGNVSESGVHITPFKDLGGLLSRLGPEQRRVGGPLTEAIRVKKRRSNITVLRLSATFLPSFLPSFLPISSCQPFC